MWLHSSFAWNQNDLAFEGSDPRFLNEGTKVTAKKVKKTIAANGLTLKTVGIVAMALLCLGGGGGGLPSALAASDAAVFFGTGMPRMPPSTRLGANRCSGVSRSAFWGDRLFPDWPFVLVSSRSSMGRFFRSAPVLALPRAGPSFALHSDFEHHQQRVPLQDHHRASLR